MSRSRGIAWTFTINNWDSGDVARLEQLVSNNQAEYIVFGYEVAPSTGTPHLQGYVRFHNRMERAAVVLTIGQAHVEVARGSAAQNRAYCTKEGVYFEDGQLPQGPGSVNAKTRVEEFVEYVKNFSRENGRGPYEREYAIAYPGLFLQYRNNLAQLVQFHSPNVALEEDGVLKPWQLDLLGVLLCEADDRKIFFMVDPQGGAGKTWLQRYLITEHPEKTQILSIAKRDDIAYAVDESKTIFCFNIPRGGMEFLQYPVLEQMKDRMIFSPKYASKTKYMQNKVHVVVFSNEEPDYSKMSRDRYDVKFLSNSFLE